MIKDFIVIATLIILCVFCALLVIKTREKFSTINDRLDLVEQRYEDQHKNTELLWGSVFLIEKQLKMTDTPDR